MIWQSQKDLGPQWDLAQILSWVGEGLTPEKATGEYRETKLKETHGRI